MGKYANIILVNDNNIIIDALKKIYPYENSKRTIVPTAKYIKPESQNKIDPFTISNINTDNLYQELQGVSPLLSKEILYRLQTNTYRDIINDISNSNNIYITNNEFHIIPLLHLNMEYTKYDLNEGLDHIYYDLEEKNRIKEITNNISKFVSRNIKQLNNKLIKLNDSLCDANKALIYKDYADLIYTYHANNLNRLDSITIVDFDNNSRVIPLDNKYSVKVNAKKYYTKYQKLNRSKHHLTNQINICESEIEYFTSLSEQLELCNYNDAKEIKEELIMNRYLQDPKVIKHKKKQQPLNITRVEYKGQTIYYGKNNLQNDYITHKLALKDYMWFHAQDYHGSHLVIDNNDLDEDTIRLCAHLASYYSKGRFSSSVGVNYTLVRNLKKIPGSKIGLVSLKTYKTIYIDPDINIINNYLMT